ncbi:MULTISPECIES: YceD family protein [unclassified Micromonospora]|uniref:YceD family protein n=1 Tax=Micromonospora TaxID=1873 RepID=UPI0022B6845C|nr:MULTISPECIES: YceD family protein [unclassified Micromonospora]MCZ7420421.1 YceD family protein [Verrucosispora sp. WMMA2121]WBB89085.1 YceD family protein [Verrucosispora sp. WMMC514]
MPKNSPTSLDPRSPLVLDTRELPRRPGALRTVERVVPAPSDLGVELIGVPEGAGLDLDLRMESVSEGVLVSGTVSGPIRGECGRCLREINDSVTVTIQELYAYENSTTDVTTEEDEVGRMQGDLIDLEPALRDAVVLALPNNPLCRQDCPGLCPECGVHRDDLPADHSHQQIDPRWAGLSQLTRTEE